MVADEKCVFKKNLVLLEDLGVNLACGNRSKSSDYRNQDYGTRGSIEQSRESVLATTCANTHGSSALVQEGGNPCTSSVGLSTYDVVF